jgi:hypothetical protein
MNIRLPRLLTRLLLLLLVAQAVEAVPAFARRHRISCTVCHAPFPRLTEFGETFAGDGFIMKEDEKERDYVTAGDPLLWLNKEFPLAVRIDAWGSWDSDAEASSDLQTPWSVKLLSGGTLTRKVGYYFYFYMSEHGDVAGVEDAYIHFDDVFDWPLDVMVGQFQTSDPLMKRELRLSFEDYQVYKTHIGNSNINLAYDRGVMLVGGIEATGTDLAGFVVNGNGIPQANASRRYDTDSSKNFGLRVSQSLGGMLSLGGFAYLGEEQELTSGLSNEVSYLGPDLGLSMGPLAFTGQYLLRTDSDPKFANGSEVETTGIVAELVYLYGGEQGRWQLTGLYNRVDSDLDDHDYETWTLSASWLAARNLRFVLEGTLDTERESEALRFGIVSAF